MAKPKFEFNKENLLRIEGWARDGADDKDIARNIGYSPQYFSEMKTKICELSEALKKGRAPLDILVESKLYRKAIGTKVKIQQAIKMKEYYFDKDKKRCEREVIKIVELEQEVPPDTTAIIFWLKNRKPKQWNKPAPKVEDDDIKSPKQGIDIDEWIKKEMDTED